MFQESFQRGMELRAKCTIFAEGCRGHLTRGIIEKVLLYAIIVREGILKGVSPV